jgi:hypothetical protein
LHLFSIEQVDATAASPTLRTIEHHREALSHGHVQCRLHKRPWVDNLVPLREPGAHAAKLLCAPHGPELERPPCVKVPTTPRSPG